MKGAGRSVSGKSGGHKGVLSGGSKSWEYTKDSAERAVESDTSRQSVDGKSLASRRKMTTAEEVEDNLSQRMEKSEECGSLGMWWDSRKRKKAPTAWGADPSTGHMNINAMNHVKFLKIDVMGSINFVKIGFVQSSKHQGGRATVC